jgi:AraC-like DNA-binding protein
MPGPDAGRFQEPTELGVRLLASAERIAVGGKLPEITRHRHAAPAVVVGVDGPLRFVAGRTHVSRAALIAPGFAHAVETGGGRIAVFVLPPHAMSGAGVAPVVDLRRPGRWVELGTALIRHELHDLSPVDLCLAREGLRTRPIDDRLRIALDALGSALDHNLPVDDIAATAGLSASRLMALAREQLGSSLRLYRRWLRAFQVARDYAAGRSLTEAALAAGFASSAHLSSATREHFGIRPSDVLSPANRSGIRVL